MTNAETVHYSHKERDNLNTAALVSRLRMYHYTIENVVNLSSTLCEE